MPRSRVTTSTAPETELRRNSRLSAPENVLALTAEPSGVAAWQLAKMNLAKANHQRRVAGKRMAFEVKQKLEESRGVGLSRLAGG